MPLHVKSRVYGLQYRGVAEGFGETGDRPARGYFPSKTVYIGGNKHYWNIDFPLGELNLQIRTGHSRHAHIKDEASCSAQVLRGQKVLRRAKRQCLKAI